MTNNETADINRRLEILKHGLWGALIVLLLGDCFGPDSYLFPTDIMTTESALVLEIVDVQDQTRQQVEEEFATVQQRIDEIVVELKSSEASP